MRTLDQIIDTLPADRRAKVKARGRELIAEEMALRRLRQARQLTQQSLANILRVKQDRVSKIESSTDMLLSTLRTYIEAMGGSLQLIVQFPDAVVALKSISDGNDICSAPPTKKPKTGRRRLELAHTID